MITVAFLNQKGGVGKSSLTFHLAGALADAGKSVLCVDWDSQASLTQAILGPDATAAIPWYETAAVIGQGEVSDPSHLVRVHSHDDRKRGVRSIAYVPGSAQLLAANTANPYDEESGGSARQCLRYFLAMAADEMGFDYALIDCPPNLAMLAAQALAAAEFLIIPTQVEDFGVQGLRPVLLFMEAAQEADNPYLKLGGIAINLRKRRKIQDHYEAALREHYRDEVFAIVLNDAAAYPDSITFRQPVTWHTRGKAAQAMDALAAEFLERTGGQIDEQQISKAG